MQFQYTQILKVLVAGAALAAAVTSAAHADAPDRPLADDLAIEPVSMLVTFNRLRTAEALQGVLNRQPGQFSRVDIDHDGNPDMLRVVRNDTSGTRGFEIHARPVNSDYVVATLVFDMEWEFLGYYCGLMDGPASTVERPLPAPPTADKPGGAEPTS